MVNSVDPDQTASSGAVGSGSALFAYAILSDTFVYKILWEYMYVVRAHQKCLGHTFSWRKEEYLFR